MANKENDVFEMFGGDSGAEFPAEINFDEFTEMDVANPFEDAETPSAMENKTETADMGGNPVNSEAIETSEIPPAVEDKNETAVEKPDNISAIPVDGNKEAPSATETKTKKTSEAAPKPSTEIVNPFEAELERVETAEAEKVKTGLLNQPPMFEFAGAKEEIADSSKTFEALRKEKAEDFPELEDANRVSWKMTYAGIIKIVSNPKKTTVAEQKKLIEDSKEFTKALKNKKADFACKVTPTVTAQKKGRMPVYMGFYPDMETAAKSGKAISFVPGDDGNIYECRKNPIGTFIAPANRVKGLETIKAGFIPALPLFPYDQLSEVITFFKRFADKKNGLEVLVNVYWDTDAHEYVIKLPIQRVGHAYVKTKLGEVGENLVHVMDIHSHNTMKAKFSPVDDADEKATRIYVVIGRLDKFFPDISTRVSVGGKFVDIRPVEIFEYPFTSYPVEWDGDYIENIVSDYPTGGEDI